MKLSACLSIRLVAVFSSTLAAVACDATAAEPGDAEPVPCAPMATAGAGGVGALPSAIECSFFFRQSNEVGEGDSPSDPKFELQEQALSVEQDDDGSVTLGKLTLNVTYSVPEDDAPSVQIVVSGETQLVRWLYQLGQEGLANQFSGDHGFTGLVYLTHPTEGGDYQLICKGS
jgi:hypothetical protein